ncbi:carbon-nitrogen hydrolase family protein [Pseudomonas sp. CCM 7891]|uniref:Carbon-nitrogen hydrolase family protein n=1 Tax=Pseudomonas karstica TaxID=1055468 RepID=A0A7X2UWL7_9PSED|nr:carbon-nitrogen hydrolase family protein [Pseudomonas karstica]MTD18134.1 carbon-nitrogen hydrolase family protein [Pseudomonas karstica]
MSFIVAAAQSVSIAQDIPANIEQHLRIMRVAARNGVQFLIFPELSLTGYELEASAQLAIGPDDARLVPIKELARNSGITTVVGAPLRLPENSDLVIGALVFHADGCQSLYSKQYLHPGEDRVFSLGTGGEPLTIETRKIALAICADAMQPSHRIAARDTNAEIYAASVLISKTAYASESKQLADYAATHHIMVLLANHGGVSGEWECAGRSSIWSNNGTLIAAADGQGQCLVIGEQNASGQWNGNVIHIGLEI